MEEPGKCGTVAPAGAPKSAATASVDAMAAFRTAAYLPALFEDETIYSLYARFNLVVGFSAAETAKLFRAPGAHAHAAVPRALDFLEKISGGLIPSSEHTLRLRTLLRAYLPLLPPKRRAVLLRVCTHEGPVAEALARSGLNRYGNSARLLRFCSSCADDERRREAVSYWHTSLQLPGTWICPTHRRLLNYMREAAGRRSGWLLPGVGGANAVFEISVPEAESQLKLWKLQQVMTWIASQLSLSPSTMQVMLRARLHTVGFCRSEFKWLQIELLHLAQLAHAHYRGINVPDIAEVNTGTDWFNLLFRERRHYDPLTWALGLSWVGATDAESLTREYAEAGARKPQPDLFDQLSRKQRRVSAPAFVYAAFAEAERKSQAIERAGLTESEVDYWLRRDRDLKIHWAAGRRERRRREATKQIGAYLLRSPSAKRVDVLKNCAPAYRWLEANDRTVLEQLLPPPYFARQLSLSF